MTTRRIATPLACIYWLMQFAGGVIAALLYEYLFLRRPVEAPGPEETGLIEPGVGE